jgi:hypothetical protein
MAQPVVYVVVVENRHDPVYVFAHQDDAANFAAAVPESATITAQHVIDFREARRLIFAERQDPYS